MGPPRDPSPDWDPGIIGENFKGKDRLFLVHLPSDIGEKKNRADENPEKLQELLKLHNDWLHKVKRAKEW